MNGAIKVLTLDPFLPNQFVQSYVLYALRLWQAARAPFLLPKLKKFDSLFFGSLLLTESLLLSSPSCNTFAASKEERTEGETKSVIRWMTHAISDNNQQNQHDLSNVFLITTWQKVIVIVELQFTYNSTRIKHRDVDYIKCICKIWKLDLRRMDFQFLNESRKRCKPYNS